MDPNMMVDSSEDLDPYGADDSWDVSRISSAQIYSDDFSNLLRLVAINHGHNAAIDLGHLLDTITN